MMRTSLAGCALLLAACWVPQHVSAAEAKRGEFGRMPDGTAVEAVTLSNGHGVSARIINLGASLQSLMTPDRQGKSADIVLGYPSLDGYLSKPNYFGATVGRFANRIAKGRFSLDGKNYSVPVNDGPNSLHGGLKGFDKVVWTITEVKSGPAASVSMRYVSPDGDQGYPGTMTVTATYSLDEKNALSIEYRATTDKPTIVNLSNHTYWNLAGEGAGTVMNHNLEIDADGYTPVDATAIPNAGVRPVAGTDFDFRKAKPIGRDIRDGGEQQLLFGRGYDHNWVVAKTKVAAPRQVARVEDPSSGRVLTLLSAQPGLQFYSGNFLDGTVVGKSGRVYRQGDAFVLEPQIFPDTPNQPALGSARLAPGETYDNLIVYRLSTN
ncbi:MAG TPA: aldose epimerase family protein [Luteibacter sp.]|nr:aldose epimerase family protein [Luteibacter sp.]